MFLISSSSVYAEEIFTSKSMLRDQLLKVGVNENKIDFLIKKIQKGEKLDCMKEKYKDIKPTVSSWTDSGGMRNMSTLMVL